MDAETGRLHQVLAGRGYWLGHQDDTLLPMIARQVFLLNRN